MIQVLPGKSFHIDRILAITLLFLNTSCKAQQKSINYFGRWEGITEMFGQKMKVAFDLSEQRKTYDADEAGIFYEALTEFSINGKGEFRLELPGKEKVILAGKIQGDQMDGNIEKIKGAKFQLNRTSSVPSFPIEQEITYKSGDVTIAGTLIKPVGSGPFPAVVLISGSAGEGKMTREKTRNMGNFFVKQGIAALIYDRRGNGKSEGARDRIIKMEWLAQDAAAGASYLSSRSDIRKDRIGFWGLSQGGWVAPYAAQLFNNTAFVITFSAPGVSPDKQNRFLINNKVSEIVNDHIQKGGAPGRFTGGPHDIEESNINDDNKEVIPGFSHFDPIPYWEKAKYPVLAIYGENDNVVPIDKSHQMIEAALVTGGNKDYEFKTFSKADHELRVTINESPRFAIMAPGCFELLAGWIKRHL